MLAAQDDLSSAAACARSSPRSTSTQRRIGHKWTATKTLSEIIGVEPSRPPPDAPVGIEPAPMEIILAWSLSCARYHGAVQRLYADPFFQKPEHQAAARHSEL